MTRRHATALAVLTTLLGTTLMAVAAEQIVGQKGKVFSPVAVHVKAGATLQFKNDDAVTHHVYSATKGQEFDLDTMKPGQGGKYRFSKHGRVEVRCGLHPGMRMVVTVD